MPVTILDMISGQVVPLSQVVASGRPVVTFEMSSSGTRSLADFIARPDTLKFLDMTSKAQITYNQALAADNFFLTILQPAAFSKRLQIGVPLSGVYVLGTDPASVVTLYDPGLVVDNTVWPPSVTGTPTIPGDGINVILETQAGALGSPFVSKGSVLEGAPLFSDNPVVVGTFQVGKTIMGSSGTAPGATSFGYQWFRRADGSTGNGAAISGAFNALRTIPDADLNYQYRLRIRAFRGSLYAEFFTPWSATIVSAIEALPTFTTASSFSGGVNVGETLTALAGNGTGMPSFKWVANDVEIVDATTSTYVIQWADRYKQIKPVVSRTNSAGVVADTAVLTPVVVTPKLSAAYFGNPSWYDNTTSRWMEPVLVTPYEPGKGGTPKIAATPTSARNRTLDPRVDGYFNGNLHWVTPGTSINSPIVNGDGRNIIYRNIDMGPNKLQHTHAVGDVSYNSIRFSIVNSDLLFYGGKESDLSGTQRTTIQNCYLGVTLGTYANPFIVAGKPTSGLNQATIKSVTKIDARQVKITIDTTTLPSGFRPPTNATVSSTCKTTYTGYVILYDVQVSAGVVSALNVDWNTNYEVVSYDPASGEIIAVPNLTGDGSPFGGTGSAVSSTGKCVAFSKVADNHSDGAQKNKGGARETRRHGNTYLGNYTVWGVDGLGSDSDNAVYHSCENIRRYFGYNPQEYVAPVIYWGPSAGTNYPHEAVNIFIENEWLGASFSRLVGSAPNHTSSTVDGAAFLAYDSPLTPGGRGGVKLGVPLGGDYTPSDRNPWTFVPVFSGQRNPTNSDITGVTFTTSGATTGVATGVEIGQLNLVAPGFANGLNDAAGRPVLVDFVITGPDAAKVTQGWSGLIYTVDAVTGPLNFQAKATVRDSLQNYGAEVSFGPVAITFTPS